MVRHPFILRDNFWNLRFTARVCWEVRGDQGEYWCVLEGMSMGIGVREEMSVGIGV